MNNEKLILKALERLMSRNVYCDTDRDVLGELRNALNPKEEPSLGDKLTKKKPFEEESSKVVKRGK